MNKLQEISQIRCENNKKEYTIYKKNIEKELGKTLEIIEYDNIPYYKDNQNKIYNLDVDKMGTFTDECIKFNTKGEQYHTIKTNLNRVLGEAAFKMYNR